MITYYIKLNVKRETSIFIFIFGMHHHFNCPVMQIKINRSFLDLVSLRKYLMLHISNTLSFFLKSLSKHQKSFVFSYSSEEKCSKCLSVLFQTFQMLPWEYVGLDGLAFSLERIGEPNGGPIVFASISKLLSYVKKIQI